MYHASYSNLDGMLSRINYAHAGSERSIEYLLGSPRVFNELGPYNLKFAAQPIQLKPIIYDTQERSYASKSEAYTPNTAKLHQEYYFTPAPFLKPGRAPSKFIGEASEIKEMVEDAFKAVTNQELAQNITIQLCTVEEMAQIHSNFGSWHPGIVGFSLNSNGNGISRIFVRKGPLDAVMVTMGHELGHVFTRTLDNAKDEEAKAFAFCLAWVQAIKEHNIGNLGDSITQDLQPAENNLHDVAFTFVKKKLESGIKALDLHWDIVRLYASLTKTIPHYAR